MARLVLKNAFVSLDGNDISGDVKSISLPLSAEMLDATAMGNDTRVKLGGLKDWNVTIELISDYDAAAIDSIMFPMVGETVPLIVRPDAGVIGVNNPQFNGQLAVESYPPIGGGVGELAASTISGQSGGDLTRTTA